MINATTIDVITRWLNYTLAIPMIIFGTIGAILTVVVFTKQPSFWRNSSITYLLAGATMTAIHLPTIYSQSILVNGFGFGLFNTNQNACREHNYLLYMTTVAAISFPCWASFDQYASTCRDTKFRNRWSSVRFARIAIIGTVLFWIIVYLPIIFVSDIVDGVCVLKKGTFTLFNIYFLSPFVYSVGPLIVMTVFTAGTVRNLRAMTCFNRYEQFANQVRQMLISQLIVLGISGIPFGFEGIYLGLTSHVEKDAFRLSVEHLFNQLILLLFHCNYVCTFYIYLYMSNEVRRATKRLFLRCVQKNNNVSDNMATENEMKMSTISSRRHTSLSETAVRQQTQILLTTI
jgi:hypothetical protein